MSFDRDLQLAIDRSLFDSGTSAYESGLEDIIEREDMQATNIQTASELFQRNKDELQANVMGLGLQIEELQASYKDVSNDIRRKEADIKNTQDMMNDHEDDMRDAKHNAELYREEARTWRRKRESIDDTHTIASVVQAGSIGLTALGAVVTPFIPPLGIVIIAAGTSTAVGLGVAKSEYTDQIERCETEEGDCNDEVRKCKDEYDTQVYLHTEKMEEIDELRRRQKQLKSEMSSLKCWRNQELLNLEQLKIRAKKVGTVARRSRIANEHRERIRDSDSTNHNRAMIVFLSETSDAINDVPGYSGGLRLRWGSRIASALESTDHAINYSEASATATLAQGQLLDLPDYV